MLSIKPLSATIALLLATSVAAQAPTPAAETDDAKTLDAVTVTGTNIPNGTVRLDLNGIPLPFTMTNNTGTVTIPPLAAPSLPFQSGGSTPRMCFTKK
jgi:hypothetical protein